MAAGEIIPACARDDKGRSLVITHKFVLTAGHSRYHGEHRGHRGKIHLPTLRELRVLRGKNELWVITKVLPLTAAGLML